MVQAILRQHNVHKGASTVMRYHGGHVSTALLELFPEIKFDKEKLPQSRWEEEENRRKAFLDYAELHRFDPFIAENWRRQSFRDKIWPIRMSIPYHNGKIATALQELFPRIKLNPTKSKGHNTRKILRKFDRSHSPTKSIVERKKRILEKFAARNGFDPLNALSWASHSRDKFIELVGWSFVKSQFNGDVVQMLSHFFPNIGLVPSMFPHGRDRWKTTERRRAYFEEYAKDNNFDPLDAENWYRHPPKYRKLQGLEGLLSHHGGSAAQALVDLFPDVEFDRLKLS